MVDPLKQSAPSQATPPPASVEDPQEVERRYLARVREECRYLDSEGVDRRRAELTDVFVMLEAVESPSRETVADVAPVPERAEEMGLGEQIAAALFGRGKTQKPGEPSPKPPPPPVPLAQALKAHDRLVILGEPGAGKSTVLQYIALCFASQGWAGERLDLDEARIPVRVELRAYDGATRLDDFLVAQLYRAYVPEQEASDWLINGRLAILLDGLDEVPEARRREVVTGIAGFTAQPGYRECRIVLTSRIAGYQKIGSGEPGFGRYTICPFKGAEDVLPYVVGWLAALGTATAEGSQDQAQVLLDCMQGQPGLRRVMGNPLLLRLAVAVYVESGEPPTNRAVLYQRYMRDVAWQRANEREASCWSQEQIEAALEAIAWTLQTQGEKTRAELAEPVEAFMARVGQCSDPIAYLQQNLGLLATYGDRQDQALIAFRHLTFQEYFVAHRLKRAWIQDSRRAWRFLRPRLHHPAWREPILLLASMLNEEQATELVRRIWKTAHSPYERELHRDMLMAASILADGANVRVQTEDRLVRSVLDLHLDFQAKWVRLLLPSLPPLVIIAALTGLCGIRWLPVLIWLLPLSEFAWLLTLHLTDEGKLPRLHALSMLPLREGVTSCPQQTQRQITAILSGLPRPHAVASLIQALGHANEFVRHRAAEALGEIGDAQAVAPLIQALGDADESVQRSAAAALGEIGDAQAVAPLIQALGDANWSTRLETAEALGKIGDAQAVAPLIQALGDANEYVREEAAVALGKIGDAQAVAPLIRALGDAEGNVRAEAAAALDKIGAPAVAPLIQALGDAEESVRAEAAAALGKIGDAQAVTPLARALGDINWNVRQNATAALGEIGDAQAVALLIQALGDVEESVRAEAAEALGEIGAPAVAPLIRALGDAKESVRRQAAAALGKIGAPAVAPLTQALGDAEESVRAEAAGALGQIGDARAVAPLIQALGTADWLGRLEAARALGQIGDTQAVAPLIQALGDANWSMREEAAAALGKIGDGEAVAPLIRALGDTNRSVRAEVAAALGKIGDAQAVVPLGQALGNANRDTRRRAAAALGEIGDAQAVAPLIRALGDTNRSVRAEVAAALGKIGDAQAVASLIQAFGDAEESVRAEAAAALGKIGDAQAVTPLARALGDINWNVRQNATAALGEIGDAQAVALLIQALGDVEESVRAEAAEALGKIGDAQAVTPLARALGDINWNVRQNATAALGEIGDAQAVALLIQALGDTNGHLSWEAAEALGKIGVPAVAPLIQALGDANRYLRWSAAEALGQIGDAQAVTPLIRALGDADESVQRSAAAALSKIGELAMAPLIQALGDANWHVRESATMALAKLPPVAVPDAQGTAWRQWWHLTSADSNAANAAMELLGRVVSQITEEEVAALGDNPPLFAPETARRSPFALLIVLSALVASISGVASNIIASYLQESYQLITNTTRFIIVAAVFIVTLVASIVIALRLDRQKS